MFFIFNSYNRKLKNVIKKLSFKMFMLNSSHSEQTYTEAYTIQHMCSYNHNVWIRVKPIKHMGGKYWILRLRPMRLYKINNSIIWCKMFLLCHLLSGSGVGNVALYFVLQNSYVLFLDGVQSIKACIFDAEKVRNLIPFIQ